MKHLPENWAPLLGRFASWGELSVQGRRAFLQLKHGQNASPGSFGADLDRLVGGAFLLRHSSGGHVVLHEDARAFSRAVRAISRHDVLSDPTASACAAYLNEHFEPEEIGRLYFALTEGDARGDPAPRLAGIIGRACRLGDFRSLEREEWDETLERDDDVELLTPPVWRAARAVLAVMEPGRSRSLGETQRSSGVDSMDIFGRAIGALVRYALLFPAIRRSDVELVLGVWPVQVEEESKTAGRSAAARVGRVARGPSRGESGSDESGSRNAPRSNGHDCTALSAGPPKPVAVLESHECFSVAEDVTALVRLVAAGPVRMCADWRLHAADMKRFVQVVRAVPLWAAVASPGADRERSRRATSNTKRLGLIGVAADRNLHLTDAGREFLNKPLHVRQALVADLFRDAEAPALDRSGRFHLSPFLPGFVVRGRLQSDDARIQRAYVRAALDLPARGSVPFNSWLEWQGARNNPLAEFEHLGFVPATGPDGHIGIKSRSELAEYWGEQLASFTLDWLLSLGAVRLGRYECVHGQTFLAIGRTPVLDYLLHQTTKWPVTQAKAEPGKVLVQPNFEVVFLAPNDAIEAELSSFCERLGTGTGAIFRVTRHSVQAAVAAGLTADAIVAGLRSAASKGVPENVEHETRAWAGACRRISAERPVILRCPDAETAAQVRRAAGADAGVIGESIVELKSGKIDAALRKKLTGMGIFVGGAV